ncbi:hypothetical protein ACLB2K_011957 [Fragaria x ananassa]
MVRKNGVNQKRPSFFKVILPGYSTEQLRIPPQFLKHLRKDLSSKANLSLNMSSQCSWNVKVTKTMNDVYFKDGWQEFLNNNSVDEAFMSAGWAEFARDKKIMVGDVCAFELLKENKMVVHILQKGSRSSY